MANPNIFLQYMKPQRSALDYMQQMDEADAVQQRNAIQELALQRTQRADARAQEVDAALRSAYGEAGGDRNRLTGVLLRSHLPELQKAADEIIKAEQDRRSKDAEIAGKQATTTKTTQEAVKERLGIFKGVLAMLGPTPNMDQAEAWVRATHADPVVGPLLEEIRPIDQSIEDLRRMGDPVRWRDMAATGVEKFYELYAAKYEDLNGKKVNTNPRVQAPDLVKTPTFADQTAAGNLEVSRERLKFDKTQAGLPVWDPTNQVFIDRTKGSVTPGPAGPNKKPLDQSQANAALFGNRALESHKVLARMEKRGTMQPGKIKRAAETVGQIVGLGTSFGDVLGNTAATLTNWTQSQEQQQVEQAQRDFINAVLRRESGAVINEQEFDNARRQYFVQPGEEGNEAVVKQKRTNREIAIRGLLAGVPEGRRGLPEVPGLKEEPPPPLPPIDLSIGVPQDIADIMAKWGDRGGKK